MLQKAKKTNLSMGILPLGFELCQGTYFAHIFLAIDCPLGYKRSPTSSSDYLRHHSNYPDSFLGILPNPNSSGHLEQENGIAKGGSVVNTHV